MDDGANLDSGYATDVSMPQQLSGTDWYMESLGLTVSFSLYADLLKTSAWATQAQQNCLTDGVCFGEIQKKGDKEEAELEKAKAAKQALDEAVEAKAQVDAEEEMLKDENDFGGEAAEEVDGEGDALNWVKADDADDADFRAAI